MGEITDRIKVLKKAQYICARQEKCRADIIRKLYEWKVEPKDHAWILEQLEKENFIDETRYTGVFVRDKFRFNKWGKTKIEFELKAKLIPDEIIREVLKTVDETEYQETCRLLLIQKLKTLKGLEPSLIKEKLIRFGYSRGFEADLIYKLAGILITDGKTKEEP
jgi:regulatory protein